MCARTSFVPTYGGLTGVWGCMHRFVCDFVDEVPDGIFECLTPSAQAAFQTVGAVGVKSRIRAQYYVMAMHSWTLADALGSFQVGHTT